MYLLCDNYIVYLMISSNKLTDFIFKIYFFQYYINPDPVQVIKQIPKS